MDRGRPFASFWKRRGMVNIGMVNAAGIYYLSGAIRAVFRDFAYESRFQKGR